MFLSWPCPDVSNSREANKRSRGMQQIQAPRRPQTAHMQQGKRARNHTAYASKTNMQKQTNNKCKNNGPGSKNKTKRYTIQRPKAISNAGTIETLPSK